MIITGLSINKNEILQVASLYLRTKLVGHETPFIRLEDIYKRNMVSTYINFKFIG